MLFLRRLYKWLKAQLSKCRIGLCIINNGSVHHLAIMTSFGSNILKPCKMLQVFFCVSISKDSLCMHKNFYFARLQGQPLPYYVVMQQVPPPSFPLLCVLYLTILTTTKNTSNLRSFLSSLVDRITQCFCRH